MKIRKADGTFKEVTALKGKDGKDAYLYATEKGYTGTAEEFAETLADATTHEYVDEEIDSVKSEFTGKVDDLEDRTRKKWVDYIVPNIYTVGEGTDLPSGEKASYKKNIELLVKLGITRVSILFPFDSLVGGKFKLKNNVNYEDVIAEIHNNGMTIHSARFSNTLYGKDKMDSTALGCLASSCNDILTSLGINDEVKIVGILNETSTQTYLNSALTTNVVDCITELKSYGYKVAITDNEHVFMQLPNEIWGMLDYVGFNSYPHYASTNGTKSVARIEQALRSYQTELFADFCKSKGCNVWVSEIGCSTTDDGLKDPADYSGTYNGNENVELLFSAVKNYINNSNVLDSVEYFSPWYVPHWEDTATMVELFGGN